MFNRRAGPAGRVQHRVAKVVETFRDWQWGAGICEYGLAPAGGAAAEHDYFGFVPVATPAKGAQLLASGRQALPPPPTRTRL